MVDSNDDNIENTLSVKHIMAVNSDANGDAITECEQRAVIILEEVVQQGSYWSQEIEFDQTNCEKNAEKRPREKSEDSSTSDDGFTVFNSRKSKRLNLSANRKSNSENVEKSFEVMLTSLQPLPKQFSLAKLLRDVKIINVIKIKYKSPYKVLVQFNDKYEAEKLLNCSKILEMNIRTQLTDQGSLSYGLIRGVDLELSDQEFMQAIECDLEIISIRRLKRMNSDGKWVDSESARLCFNNPVCPDYIHVYGSRIKVERFVFPVTQCAGCWKYGHYKRFCPLKKILCPKCGEQHENCETTIFKCVNCKGKHMALDKNCPLFLKEKRIRVVMSETNVTYKNALEIVLEEFRQSECDITRQLTNIENFPSLSKDENYVQYSSDSILNASKNYAMVAASIPVDIYNLNTIDRENGKVHKQNQKSMGQKSVKEKFKITNMQKELVEGQEYMNTDEEQVQMDDSADTTKHDKMWKFEWKKIFLKIKEIVFSNMQVQEKIIKVVTMVVSEIKSFVINQLVDGEGLKKIISMLCSG